MCEGRDLPWLQDTSAADWWGRWSPVYRDLVILDGEGELAGVFNMTERPISSDDNYAALREQLIEIAEAQ